MTALTKRSLTIKYAGLQGIYWMAFCAVYSFAAVFLLGKGFNNGQIGWLLALASIISVFLQPIVGSLADKATKITLKAIISIISMIIIILLVGLVSIGTNLMMISLLYGGVIALTLTLQPLINSLVFEYINKGIRINYGMTRGIGSLTFAFISFVLGQFLNHFEPSFISFVCIGLFICFLLLTQTFPIVEKKNTPSIQLNGKKSSDSFLRFVTKYDRFLPFLLALTALFTFHTIVNTYLVQIMTHLGGRDGDFGLSLTIAAICELPAMLGFGYMVSKVKSGTLLKVAGCFYVVRAVLFLSATSVVMINFAQLFQGLSFAIFTPASVYYVNHLMNEEDKVKGQTFIIGATTLGNVFGSLLGGKLLDQTTIHTMLLVGVAAALLGCLLLFYSVTKTSLQEDPMLKKMSS